mmetsp:Transcript_9488/g.23285  ORF Transcript_9488/g.23285 Transcript_9488/m.23285 type:complete len:313 (+) Transcript_9488:82-1020(+)|eukprot:CAMPEP_0197195800 /NCGR_PEP_ID=MMETSP1423-20130617/31858_1 /TAXON_ID=476441 /ORGANISM="Pseudo-nitzschia heimii, Strain UNC1101" /LENGTH=312 /DNA_ID=CAMNT_0042649541 /DNA_START=82 /DNA_END=1020 /DNA_ORIENTATION=-
MTTTTKVIPVGEKQDMQREEVHALEAIFDGAVDLRSFRGEGDCDFEFPIVYRINLNQIGGSCSDGTKNWPNRPLVVEIKYPKNYPSDDENEEPTTTVPSFELLHENTVLEFPSSASEKLVTVLCETAVNERGMPCVLSCLYAARDFLDGDREWQDNSGSKGDPQNEPKAANDSRGGIVAKNDTIYACISTHHLFDHKPDNLLKNGHKFNLSGFYKFGTPGIAIVWGDEDSIEEFLDTLKRAMPQKKIHLIFSRKWEAEDQIPKGWKGVNPPTLKEELVKVGVSEEDYYTALGVEKSKNKHATSKNKGKNKNN